MKSKNPFRLPFRRLSILLLVFSSIVLLSISLLFINFANNINKIPKRCDHSDAIVAITGGRGRIKAGLDLLLSGRGEYLIISGVDSKSDLESIFFMKVWREKVLPENVIVEKRSRSTYENALETKKIIDKYHFRSIILLTSVYHMKRALFTFRSLLPLEIKVCAYPVETSNFKADLWWKDRGSFAILLGEFIKFYWYRLLLL